MHGPQTYRYRSNVIVLLVPSLGCFIFRFASVSTKVTRNNDISFLSYECLLTKRIIFLPGPPPVYVNTHELATIPGSGEDSAPSGGEEDDDDVSVAGFDHK